MIPLTQEGLNSSVQEISGSPFATVKLFREHLMEGAAETMAQRLAGVSLVHVGCAAFCFYNPTQSLTPRRCSEHDCGVSEHIHPGVSPMSRLSSPEALRSWAEESLSPAPPSYCCFHFTGLPELCGWCGPLAASKATPAGAEGPHISGNSSAPHNLVRRTAQECTSGRLAATFLAIRESLLEIWGVSFRFDWVPTIRMCYLAKDKCSQRQCSQA